MLETTVQFAEEKVIILPENNQGKIVIYYKKGKTQPSEAPSLYLACQEKNIYKIETTPNLDPTIVITPPEALPITALTQSFTHLVHEDKVRGSSEIIQYVENCQLLLEKFGFIFQSKPQKKRPVKAQHRFRKELSTIEFYVDDFEAKATVIWQKRNEMCIKKGAILRPTYALNKDGSVGLNARMGMQLRQEQADKINDFTTIDDIVLKSVNEVGLFLYFGGTNGWLVLTDKNNKTIDEWSAVK